MWDTDYDVKEYHPKKRARAGSESADLDKSIPFPRNAAAEMALSDNIMERSGGIMMKTSEILDFAEGSDSY